MTLVTALLALACNERPPTASSPPEPAGPPKSVRLVVVITIDQLPTWSFERDRKLLRGGLARLLDRGLYVASAEFPYANTYTAPGHATIGTGASPNVTGILANTWFRPGSGEPFSCVDDPDYATLGHASGSGVSGRMLRVDGVADVLRQTTGGRARSVSLSLKDRSAALLLGRRPDLALWYDEGRKVLTTSTYYSETVPTWVTTFNDDQPVNMFAAVWTPLDAELLARTTGIPDDADGESKAGGFDRSFPHDLAATDDPGEALALTPTGTQLVLDAAHAAIVGEELGADAVPDLLGVSISTHDYAGHYWGQESWERLDLLLRLDRQLGEFLDFLDERLGADGYAVLVTSDHGANRLPERAAPGRQAAQRVSTLRLVQAAGEAANAELGPGRWVTACSASTLYLSPAFDRLPMGQRARATAAMKEAIAAIPGVAYVRETSDFDPSCKHMSGLDALACRSTSDESGALFIAPTEGSILSAGYRTGTGHGSPSQDDRFVPIIVAGPGIDAAQISDPVSMLQVAPTISSLLGIPAPPAASEPSLIDWGAGPSPSRGESARTGTARPGPR